MAKPPDPNAKQIVTTNRVARRDFEILDTYEAGIVLVGSEVKALRESGRTQMAEAFGRVTGGEIWLLNLHISPYSHSSAAFAHQPDRPRKLLLHRTEIDKIRARIDQQALTLVPLSLYFVRGRAKVEIGLARRKHKADRRQDIARREADLEARRAMSRAGRHG